MAEACSRCGGKGVVTYKVGYPGQDRRLIPYAEIRWMPAVKKRCPVCLGMKVQQPKRNYPPERMHIWWNTELTDDELGALLKSMNLEVSDE